MRTLFRRDAARGDVILTMKKQQAMIRTVCYKSSATLVSKTSMLGWERWKEYGSALREFDVLYWGDPAHPRPDVFYQGNATFEFELPGDVALQFDQSVCVGIQVESG